MNKGRLHIHPAERILEQGQTLARLLNNLEGIPVVFYLFEEKDQQGNIENDENRNQSDPHLDIKIACRISVIFR